MEEIKQITPEIKEAVLDVIVGKERLENVNELINILKDIYSGYAEDHLAANGNVAFEDDETSYQLTTLRKFIKRIETFVHDNIKK